MRAILLPLLTLSLIGCTGAAADHSYTLDTIAVQTATPITLPDSLAAGSAITIALAAAGTPEAVPTMVLNIRIYDDATGQPMKANIVWIVAEELRPAMDVDLQWDAEGVDLRLPGSVAGWLVISAEGYEPWTLQVRYRILTSRKMDMPVRMIREGSSL